MLKRYFIRSSRILSIFVILMAALMDPASTQAANRTDIIGPAGSVRFGSSVTVLPNGNFVVTDPQYSPAADLPR